MSEIVENTLDLIPESVFGVPINEIINEAIISEIVSEPIISEIINQPIINEIVSEPIISEIINQPIISEIISETIINAPTILIDEITKITFSQIFENFLSKNNDQLTEYNITITPNMHKYFTLLCKENNSIFNEIELTLKTIISDDKIKKEIPAKLATLSGEHWHLIRNVKSL